jgi:DNA repair ATPase RecN
MNLSTIIDLRVSEAYKYKEECRWFKDVAEYLVPHYSTSIDDFNKMKLSYDVVNNNLDGFKDEIDNFLSPLNEDLSEVREKLMPYNKLHNKKNVLVGELIKRPETLKAVLLNTKAVKDKNKKFQEALQQSLEELVAITFEMEKAKLDPNMGEEDINSYKEQLKQLLSPEDLLQKDFLTEWEILYNKLIKYAYFDQDILTKKAETLEDVIIADRCIVLTGS